MTPTADSIHRGHTQSSPCTISPKMHKTNSSRCSLQNYRNTRGRERITCLPVFIRIPRYIHRITACAYSYQIHMLAICLPSWHACTWFQAAYTCTPRHGHRTTTDAATLQCHTACKTNTTIPPSNSQRRTTYRAAICIPRSTHRKIAVASWDRLHKDAFRLSLSHSGTNQTTSPCTARERTPVVDG